MEVANAGAASGEATVRVEILDLAGATGLDEAFPDVFVAWASCADAKVDLAGLPYEFWSLGLFVVIGAGEVRTVRTATLPPANEERL